LIEKQSTGIKPRKGGRRPGAGRKPGVRNKRTEATVKAIEQSGMTPLDFMLSIMRGEHPEGAEPAQVVAWESMRFEAAKAAAPYVHPKLANIEHTGKGGGPVVIQASSHDEQL
jgi:hypothetical protein